MTYIDLHCDTISELQKQKKHWKKMKTVLWSLLEAVN